MTLMVPHDLYGICIIWSPNMYIWPPHVLCESYGPHTLYGIGILWSPLPYMDQVLYGPLTCTYGPPHVKCLHVLYDSYGPPYLIWNRYHMAPHMYVWSPHMYVWSHHMISMTLMVPLTLYGTGIVWSPQNYVWSSHMYDLMSPLPYMDKVSYGSPHMYDMIFQDNFERGPLRVLKRLKGVYVCMHVFMKSPLNRSFVKSPVYRVFANRHLGSL